ncbi:hypothetical protein D3C87_1932520 [compost metagenome]
MQPAKFPIAGANNPVTDIVWHPQRRVQCAPDSLYYPGAIIGVDELYQAFIIHVCVGRKTVELPAAVVE